MFAGFERLHAHAALRHVTVFGSAGDTGSTSYDITNDLCMTPMDGFPASFSARHLRRRHELYTEIDGNHQSETVWNKGLDGGARGGGISQVFGEPIYQRLLPRPTQKLLGGHRGFPDVAWNADPFTPMV